MIEYEECLNADFKFVLIKTGQICTFEYITMCISCTQTLNMMHFISISVNWVALRKGPAKRNVLSNDWL